MGTGYNPPFGDSPAVQEAISSNADVSANTAARHDQNTDTKLDEGGANEVTAAEAKTAYDHSQIVTGNPHSLDSGDVGADPAGTAATAVSDHEAAGDPHPQYMTQAETDMRIAGSVKVYRVGDQSPYATIQAAVDAAEAASPTKESPAIILIPPKEWDEDVVIKKSFVHLWGLGAQGAVRIQSLIYTNATDASVTAYESSDDPGDLVAETQVGIPWDNQLRNVEIWNQLSNAQASLRFLGAGDGTSFFGNELLMIDCTVRASGASQNGKAIDGVLANYLSTGGYCWIPGQIRLRNVCGFWPLGAQLGAIVYDYDSGAAYGEPSDTGVWGISGKGSFFTGAITITNEARIGGDPAVGHYFESTITATGTGSSSMRNCSLLGNVSLGAGTSLDLQAGSLVGTVSGAGTFTWDSDNYFDFDNDIASPSHHEGRLFYEKDKHALSYYNDESEVEVNLGQEVMIRVKNETGGPINNGELVYINGAESIENIPTVAKAKADVVATSKVLGMATHTIEDGTFGYVTISGLVHGINTATYSDGDTLWLSPSTAGGFTDQEPTTPNKRVVIGYVAKSAASGKILVQQINDALTTQQIKFGWAIPDTDDAVATEHEIMGAKSARLSAATVDPTPTTQNHVDSNTALILVNITTLNTAGTLRLTGTSWDPETATETASDTEDIAISATGYAVSTKEWRGTVVLSSVGGLDVVLDSYRWRPLCFGCDCVINCAAVFYKSTAVANSSRLLIQRFNPSSGFTVLVDETISDIASTTKGSHCHSAIDENIKESLGDRIYILVETKRVTDYRFDICGEEL